MKRLKLAEGKKIYDECKRRGWVENNNTLHHPNSKQAELLAISTGSKSKSKRKSIECKTGWIDDTRNIRNKQKKVDVFIRLVEVELGVEVWPEFFFLIDREYRFDYAIPVFKIAVEVEGGIWAKGNSGHSSGKGILRDMDKGTLANVSGWTLIRRTPAHLRTNETLELIKKAMINGQVKGSE
jgi:hypothetical protein